MPEEEDEKPASKGMSVKSGFFGRVSYVYEYDGNKTDAPRAAANEDEWVVRNYRNSTNRIAVRDDHDTSVRADVHREHYNSGSVYSHHSFSARKRVGEEPRWPAAEKHRGNVHGKNGAEGMLKTAPRSISWWGNSKAQPTKTPISNRRARGAHISTFERPTGPLLIADDVSGRQRCLLVDSDRVDARFEQQEGGHELGAWCKDETVPRLLVRKDAWEAMQATSERVEWRDGSKRWTRGIEVQDSTTGERCLLIRRRTAVKGVVAPREWFVRLVYEIVGGGEGNSVSIISLKTAWSHQRITAGCNRGDWDAELAGVPLTTASLIEDAADLAGKRNDGGVQQSLAGREWKTDGGAKREEGRERGGEGEGGDGEREGGCRSVTESGVPIWRGKGGESLSKGAGGGGGAATYYIPVALHDSELVYALQKLRQDLSDASSRGATAVGASSICAFEKGKSAAIMEFKRRIGVGPKGRVVHREEGGRRGGGGRRRAGCDFEMLSLTRDWDVLRLGEVASPKVAEGGYRGFEVCISGCEAGKRAGRAVGRGNKWASARGEGGGGVEGNGGGGRRSRSRGRSGSSRGRSGGSRGRSSESKGRSGGSRGRSSESKGRSGGSRGRSSESKGRMLRSVSDVVQDLVWGICEVGIGATRSPHWNVEGGMSLSLQEKAARGGLRGPSRCGW